MVDAVTFASRIAVLPTATVDSEPGLIVTEVAALAGGAKISPAATRIVESRRATRSRALRGVEVEDRVERTRAG
ncbi:hypothetical protein BMW26_02525 [Microbacterium sp. 1.5R]|nr:hypothetical protein BMW26_02525 [Microbacterium sp. 1.5R]